MWDEINQPFPNFNDTIEVWKRISTFIPHFMMDVITYPSLTTLVKGAPGVMTEISFDLTDCLSAEILCLIFITIYGAVCVQLAHFSIGDWKDLSIAHVIIIIKSEVSTFPIVIIFSLVVCLKCLLHHILLLIADTFRENREFVFIIIVQYMMSANDRICFVLKIVFLCLYITPSHYHHCANLSEDIELIKCLSDIFCWVCE